jgi:hypothetical protein
MSDSTCQTVQGTGQKIYVWNLEDAAGSVLVGSFMPFDIVSCFSTRSALLLDIYHLGVRKTLVISLETSPDTRI